MNSTKKKTLNSVIFQLNRNWTELVISYSVVALACLSFPHVATYYADMWLKILIVLLFIANLVALGSAFYTLLVDQGQASKRTARLLLLRVSLAVLLLLVISYGVWSGQLGVYAPWNPGPRGH